MRDILHTYPVLIEAHDGTKWKWDGVYKWMRRWSQFMWEAKMEKKNHTPSERQQQNQFTFDNGVAVA